MPTFYLDMDGVVADWTGGVEKLVGYSLEDPQARYPNEIWKKIKQHQHIYRDLEVLPRADKLVNLARKFRDELGWELLFLTAIPHDNDMGWSFWDKMKWAEKHFSDIPVHFGPYSKDKDQHCNPGDILVDDRNDNCDAWEKAGGTAVRVRWNEYGSAIKEVEEILEKKLALKRFKNYGT